MSVQLDPNDRFDLALLLLLKREGAQQWEVVSKTCPDRDPDRSEWFYAVKADAWATDWRYADNDDADDDPANRVRQFQVWPDHRGVVHVERYNEVP